MVYALIFILLGQPVSGRDLMRLIMGKWGTYADLLAAEKREAA